MQLKWCFKWKKNSLGNKERKPAESDFVWLLIYQSVSFHFISTCLRMFFLNYWKFMHIFCTFIIYMCFPPYYHILILVRYLHNVYILLCTLWAVKFIITFRQVRFWIFNYLNLWAVSEVSVQHAHIVMIIKEFMFYEKLIR